MGGQIILRQLWEYGLVVFFSIFDIRIVSSPINLLTFFLNFHRRYMYFVCIKFTVKHRSQVYFVKMRTLKCRIHSLRLLIRFDHSSVKNIDQADQRLRYSYSLNGNIGGLYYLFHRITNLAETRLVQFTAIVADNHPNWSAEDNFLQYRRCISNENGNYRR